MSLFFITIIYAVFEKVRFFLLSFRILNNFRKVRTYHLECFGEFYISALDIFKLFDTVYSTAGQFSNSLTYTHPLERKILSNHFLSVIAILAFVFKEFLKVT